MAIISKFYKKTVTDALRTLSPALKCCLMKNTHPYASAVSQELYAAISVNECSGTGYTAGGILLSVPASSQVGDNAKFTASPAIFSGVTLTARYAVVYDPTTGRIVSQHDLGGDKPCVGGTLTLTWNTNGILTVS
jgi:hypothetical protein